MQASKVNDYVTKGRRRLDASLSLPSGKVFASLTDAFGLRFESEDGFLRYEYCPSREYTAKRLRETKEILSDFMQMYPIYGHLSQEILAVFKHLFLFTSYRHPQSYVWTALPVANLH
jgi:hypothetical protein